MNERIKELWTQGTQTGMPREGDYSSVSAKNIEKFAELIVRECMRMCEVAEVGYDSHGHTKEADGCASAKEYIAEHFGVEE